MDQVKYNSTLALNIPYKFKTGSTDDIFIIDRISKFCVEYMFEYDFEQWPLTNPAINLSFEGFGLMLEKMPDDRYQLMWTIK